MWWKNPVKFPKGAYSFSSNCCQWINKVKCPLPFVQLWARCQCWIGSKQDISPTVRYRKTQVRLKQFTTNQKNSSKPENIYNATWTVWKSLSSDHVWLQLKALTVFSERFLIPRQYEELLRIVCPHTYQGSYNTWEFSFHAIFQDWFLNGKAPFVTNGGYVDKAQQVGIY